MRKGCVLVLLIVVATLVNVTYAAPIPGFTQVSSTINSISLEWDSFPSTNGFSICKNPSGTTYRDCEIISDGTSTSHTYSTSVSANTQYTIAIRARDFAGPIANTASAIVTFTAPNSPGPLVFSSSTSSSISFVQPSSTGGSASVSYEICCDGICSTMSTVSGLLPETRYGCTVRAYNSAVSSSPTTSVAYFYTLLPTTPTGVGQTDATVSSVTLEWQIVTGPNQPYNYKVCRGISCFTTSTNSYTYTGLANGNTGYSFSITTVNSAGVESEATMVTGYTIPNAATNLIVNSGRTSTSLPLSWSASTGASLSLTFEVCCGVNTCKNETSPITTTVIGSLSAGTAYLCSVRSINAVGSVISSQVPFKTLPASPSSIQQKGATTTSVNLEWQGVNGTTGPYSYEVCRSGGTCFPTSNTTYTYSGLVNANTAYTFTISAIDSSTPQLKSTATSFIGYTGPNGVSAVTVSSRTTSSLTLQWSISGGNAQTVTFRVCCGIGYCNTGISITSLPVTGLPVNTLHNCSVTTSTPIASGPIPTIYMFTTTPTSVSGLNAYNIDNREFDLSWNELSGTSGPYTYRICKQSNIDCNTTFSSPFTYSNNVTGNTAYTMSIQVIDVYGQTSAVSQILVTTGPNAVYSFDPISRNNTSISFAWSYPGGTGSTYSYTLCCRGGIASAPFCSTTQSLSTVITGLSVNSVYNCSMNTTTLKSIVSQYYMYSTAITPVNGWTQQYISDSYIDFKWNSIIPGNPSSGPYTYSICTQIDTNCVTTTNINMRYTSGISANAIYTLCIKVGDNYGQKFAPICQQFETLATITSSFSGLENRKTHTSIYLQWTPAAATSYEIVMNNTTSYFTTATIMNVTNIRPSTWYKFEIFSLNSARNRSSSSAIVTKATLPQPVDNLRVATSTSASIGFTWNYGSGPYGIPITNYRLCIVGTSICKDTSTATVGYQWINENVFKEANRYTISVSAQNSIGNYSSTTMVNVITPRSAPNITFVDSSIADQVMIVWKPVQKRFENSLSYRIRLIRDGVEVYSEDVVGSSLESQNHTILFDFQPLVYYDIEISTFSTYNGVEMISEAPQTRTFSLPLSDGEVAAIGTTVSLISVVGLAVLLAILLIIIIIIVVIIVLIKRGVIKVQTKKQANPNIELVPMLPGDPTTAEFMIDSRQVEIISANNATSIMHGRFLGMEASIKMIPKQMIGVTSMTSYYSDLKRLHSIPTHQHLARVFGAYEIPSSDSIGLVFEYCSNGTVADLLSRVRLDFGTKLILLQGIARGLEALHSNQLAHYSLHVGNVLVDEDSIAKVVDYGFVNKSAIANQTDPLLTASYTSPELLKQLVKNPAQRNSVEFYQKSDVYSFGMLVFAIYFQNRSPFGSNYSTNRQIVDRLCMHPDTRPQFNEATVPQREKFLMDLMKQCWSTDPNRRPNFSQIVARLNQQ